MNFVNGVEETQVFQDSVIVYFSPIGPVTSTECRLDNDPFVECEIISNNFVKYHH